MKQATKISKNPVYALEREMKNYQSALEHDDNIYHDVAKKGMAMWFVCVNQGWDDCLSYTLTSDDFKEMGYLVRETKCSANFTVLFADGSGVEFHDGHAKKVLFKK